MIKAILAALAVGLAINGVVFDFGGIVEAAHHHWSHNLPKGLEALVALGILTEAQLNGAHSARDHWSSLWRRLGLLLVIALALRGIAIFVASELLGLEHSSLIATGLTATDPAAVGIALSMAKSGSVHKSLLEGLFWLLAVESMLNDAEGLIAFNIAKGTALLEVGRMLLVTTLLALIAVACGTTGVRWFVRFWLFGNGNLVAYRKYEPYIEVALVAVVYAFAIYLGIALGASLIGMVAIGAIVADIFLHKLQHEQAYTNHEHIREHIYDAWNNFGLAIVFGVVLVFMPFREMFDLGIVLPALAILAAIFAARAVFEVLYLPWQRKRVGARQASWEMFISGPAAVCLLGVPSIVGFEMYIHGYHHDSLIVLTTVALSWISVTFTVLLVRSGEKAVSRVRPIRVLSES